ncbi:MAG TPA: CocE/NonD family hydrolase [Terriglobales bacterium]|nr:CocE/NonD family hydrolase [Terriglobales bacterium]
MATTARVLLLVCMSFSFAAAQETPEAPLPPKFTRTEVMVPMRDGVHLQTVIFAPVDQNESLPILMLRTPYGVPDTDKGLQKSAAFKELVADGYIFVFQNLRGRFKSEGTFKLSSAPENKQDPKSTSEGTDAYDTIDWLVKNVPKNNRKVGIFGVSYDGLTAALSLLDPHPALKAISEQASPADQWMNDDFHRYGAFRLSYGFEYSVMEEADKEANTHFQFDTYDTYDWYLKLGPLSNADAKYLHGTIPEWNHFFEHPNYDAFWKKEAFVDSLQGQSVAVLNVAGWWDQEDPWGPWKIFSTLAKNDPQHHDFMVAGPWNHGGWWGKEGSSLGIIPFGGHKTSLEFREDIEAPFFRYYLHGKGEPFSWAVKTFETGSNTWDTYSSWPPKNAKPLNLYFQSGGGLGFEPATNGGGYAEYVSDPADPVPYRRRPISPTYPGGDWPYWEVEDQRFVEHRPDVLTFETGTLDHDVRVSGELSADLFASTSGTDSDWVVKLIDVYAENAQPSDFDKEGGPAPGEYGKSLNGYELMIAGEVLRSRFRESFENPQPLKAGAVTEFKIPLRSHDHVFLKGHRIMVQVQSTWFPVIDRNPQKFVSNIYEAKASDYVKATQRIYFTPQAPSHIVLPVVEGGGAP